MGVCPDWFPVVQAAHYYGIEPWLLLDKPKVWVDWALTADSAMNEARNKAQAQPWRKS